MICYIQGLDDIIEFSWPRPQVFEEADTSPVTLCQGHDQGDEAQEGDHEHHLLRRARLPAARPLVHALALLQVVEDVAGGAGGVGEAVGGAAALTQPGVPVPAPGQAPSPDRVVTLTRAPVGNIDLNRELHTRYSKKKEGI